MPRKHNAEVPTLYEIACMSVMKQAGGEFVDVPTIRLRLSRHGIETHDGTIRLLLDRFEKRGFVFATQQNFHGKGESYVFYTITDEGCAWLEKWQAQLKVLL